MKEDTSNYYHTSSAVLFIIFNRVDTSLKVLEEIKKARPKRLYLTADGPRIDREGEAAKCSETKSAVLKAIDWDCEVKTLFRKQNVGPKEAISSALTWFFEHEPEGIILEHDCLPANSFFKFCDTLLDKYRSDSRIWLISGSNLLAPKKFGNSSYYFSNLTNAWGWATWKRCWKDYDKDLSQCNEEDAIRALKCVFEQPLIIEEWLRIFKDTKAGKIDTWDYQAAFAQLLGHQINIISNNNLISNIGFGELAENTTDVHHKFSNIQLEELEEIKHPNFMVPEKEADLTILWEEFKIDLKIKYLKKQKEIPRRLKLWLGLTK
jgi:hypothetical protein